MGENGLFSAEAVSSQEEAKIPHSYRNVGFACRGVIEFPKLNDVSFKIGVCTDRVNLEILKERSNVLKTILDRGPCQTPTTLGRESTDGTKLPCIFVPNFVRCSAYIGLFSFKSRLPLR